MKHISIFIMITSFVILSYSCDNSAENDQFETKTLNVSIKGVARIYTIDGLISSTENLTEDQKNNFSGGTPEYIDIVSKTNAIFHFPLNSFFSGLSINVTYSVTDTTQIFYFNTQPDSYKEIFYKKGNEIQQYVYYYGYNRETDHSSYSESKSGTLTNPNDTTLPKTMIGNDTLRYYLATISYK